MEADKLIKLFSELRREASPERSPEGAVDTLEPQGLSTRAQAATVLMNAGSFLGGF